MSSHWRLGLEHMDFESTQTYSPKHLLIKDFQKKQVIFDKTSVNIK